MSNLHVTYLLVGGGVASSAAAQAIRERDLEGSVLLVGQEVNRPYERRKLSSDYLLGKVARSAIFTLGARWLEENRVELRTQRRASTLDPQRRTVTLDSGEEVNFDKLLIATGASSRTLKIPGAELPNVYVLRTLDDADRMQHGIHKALREGRPHAGGRGKAAVIGGGALGVELAATFSQLGLEVDLILSAAAPWSKCSGEGTGRFIARLLESKGVHVHSGKAATRFEGDGRVQRVVMADESRVDCDFVATAVGFAPNKDLLRGSAVAAEQAILVDPGGRTNVADIYAAGDCAAIFDPLFGKYRLVRSWDGAAITGRLAGINMTGGDEKYDALSAHVTKIFDVPLRVLGAAQLVNRRLVRGVGTLESPDFADIGIGADGRVAQAVGVGKYAEDEDLVRLVATRTNVTGREEALKDPAAPLR